MLCFQKPLLELKSLVKKMKLVHSHKAKEDIFPNYILALLSRSDAPVLKSPSTLKRALALKAVD